MQKTLFVCRSGCSLLLCIQFRRKLVCLYDRPRICASVRKVRAQWKHTHSNPNTSSTASSSPSHVVVALFAWPWLRLRCHGAESATRAHQRAEYFERARARTKRANQKARDPHFNCPLFVRMRVYIPGLCISTPHTHTNTCVRACSQKRAHTHTQNAFAVLRCVQPSGSDGIFRPAKRSGYEKHRIEYQREKRARLR